jgi:hypothetical protein
LYVLLTNPEPFRVSPGVNQASGWPSNCERTSAPCRCTTAGMGPLYGTLQGACIEAGGPFTQLLLFVVPSGSAQCSDWSTVSRFCRRVFVRLFV